VPRVDLRSRTLTAQRRSPSRLASDPHRRWRSTARRPRTPRSCHLHAVRRRRGVTIADKRRALSAQVVGGAFGSRRGQRHSGTRKQLSVSSRGGPSDDRWNGWMPHSGQSRCASKKPVSPTNDDEQVDPDTDGQAEQPRVTHACRGGQPTGESHSDQGERWRVSIPCAGHLEQIHPRSSPAPSHTTGAPRPAIRGASRPADDDSPQAQSRPASYSADEYIAVITCTRSRARTRSGCGGPSGMLCSSPRTEPTKDLAAGSARG
jgi:hypothetical protein